MPIIANKSIQTRRAAGLLWVMLCCLGGCAHINSGQLLALAPLMQEATDGQSSMPWPWLALGAAAMGWAVILWWRRTGNGGRAGHSPGAPLEPEDMALYRTARDSLSFLIKRRLRRTKVVTLDLVRRNKQKL